MESTRPVMLNDEVRDLPDHAGAAMSRRALARMLEILPHTGADPWPQEATCLMTRLVAELETIATTTDLGPSTFVLGHKGYKESQRILKLFENEPYSHVAWLCVQAAMTASGSGAQSTSGWCAHLTWDITPKQKSQKAKRIVESANWDDFKKVRLAYESGKLTDSTPLDPDDLGPLWPKGPHDWSEFTWKDLEAEQLELERESREYEEQQELRQQILESLTVRNECLTQSVRDAIDSISDLYIEKFRHAFIGIGDQPSKKWPAAIRKPTTPFLNDLREFYLVHAWGGFFIPKDQHEAALWIIPPADLSKQKKCMLEWDCALDCFDPEAIETANQISKSNGWDSDAKIAPCSKRDLIVFAQVHESPDAFFVVTKGPAAGQIFYFDHETGIDFDEPVADSLASWVRAIGDSSHDWPWLEDMS